MDELIAHRYWVRRLKPFPHVTVQNVFNQAFYDTLEDHYRRIAADGTKFNTKTPGYDASMALIRDNLDGPLAVFTSREWHDIIAGVAGVSCTGDVSASLHRHRPGGNAGWPHNDLNPGWFAGPAPNDTETRREGTDGVDYRTGKRPDGVDARETVRAVAVLFYLANPPWEPEDGGETGLFASLAAGQRGDGLRVPPLNNSMVMFECTPFSWHGYAGSSRNERNCVAMWLHRPKQDVIETFGEASIVYW